MNADYIVFIVECTGFGGGLGPLAIRQTCALWYQYNGYRAQVFAWNMSENFFPDRFNAVSSP